MPQNIHPARGNSMKISGLRILAVSFLLILLSGCGGGNGNKNFVVIGVGSGIESLNPMYSMTETESNICDLIYLPLVTHRWENETGEISPVPMAAKTIDWSADSASVKVTLRNDVYWSDGIKLTADDVVFSYDVYSDPNLETRFFGLFKNFILNPDLSINISKSFTVLNPEEIQINFSPGSKPTSFDLEFPIIPQHIFGKISRKELANTGSAVQTVGAGAYKLKSFEKSQSVTLELNKQCFLAEPTSPDRIIFKIIPEYNSRINQLRNGEIDYTDNVRAEDASSLSSNGDLEIVSRKGREYDYFGLNNIDPASFNGQGKLQPNRFFADPVIRKALALAIDRKSILEQFLLNRGQLMTGPVAPIFKSFVDASMQPYPYDPQMASELLKRSGWNDSDGDGILDKGGQKFSFALNVPSGNPLRTNAATVIQNNLKALGVDAKIEMLEPAVLADNMFSRKMDAWLSGWGVAIPLDLKPYWYSDFEQAPANTAGYMSKKVDVMLDSLEIRISKPAQKRLLIEIQKTIFEDEPVVFLYWLDNIVVYNRRITNLNINPLNSVSGCWDWRL